MRPDRRGDIGFMEAMVAAITVTVVLAAFIGAVALKVYDSEISPGQIDVGSLTRHITVSDRGLEGDLQEELDMQLEKYRLNGASIRCVSVPGTDGRPAIDGELFFYTGHESGELYTERRLCPVDTDDGFILLNVEVKVWR